MEENRIIYNSTELKPKSNPWHEARVFAIKTKLRSSLILDELKAKLFSQTKIRSSSLQEDAQYSIENRDKLKPHILTVTQKWMGTKPEKGETIIDSFIFGSLDACNLATYTKFYFDEYFYNHQKKCDAELINLCKSLKPDFLFFAYYNNHEPSLGTLKFIRNRLKIPIVIIWWEVYGIEDLAAGFVDLNIVCHSTAIKRSKYPEKYLQMWIPHDPTLYYNPELERTIPVSFLGSAAKGVPQYSERWKSIEALKSNGINVSHMGGASKGEAYLAEEDYAKIHQTSKIALSFGQGRDWDYRSTGEIIPHTKARIFEVTLCGAMLMDNLCSETNLWFEPYHDYVPFKSEQDLIEKTKYYLENEDEREIIARNGHQKAIQNYTGKRFWETVLSKVLMSN